MSVLLLDTHAYVWAVTAPDNLSDTAHTALRDSAATLLVSAASAWEMAIKLRAGKWPEAEPLLRQHRALRTRLRAEERPITEDDAIRAGGLTWNHADPFDRILAAQALLSHATLVTRDEAFHQLPGLLVLW